LPQNEGYVLSLEKSLKILAALAAAGEGIGLSDLSRRRSYGDERAAEQVGIVGVFLPRSGHGAVESQTLRAH